MEDRFRRFKGSKREYFKTEYLVEKREKRHYFPHGIVWSILLFLNDPFILSGYRWTFKLKKDNKLIVVNKSGFSELLWLLYYVKHEKYKMKDIQTYKYSLQYIVEQNNQEEKEEQDVQYSIFNHLNNCKN